MDEEDQAAILAQVRGTSFQKQPPSKRRLPVRRKKSQAFIQKLLRGIK
ncbi:MAG: hypothetical protein ACREEM_02805 [Blastocatellia bacterium]